MKKTIEAYKEEILQAICDIGDFTAGIDIKTFIKNKQAYNATVLSLLLIGELFSKISVDIRQQNKDIPWDKVIGLRNRIAHDYFGLDADVLWDIVKTDLPKLKVEIQKLHD